MLLGHHHRIFSLMLVIQLLLLGVAAPSGILVVPPQNVAKTPPPPLSHSHTAHTQQQQMACGNATSSSLETSWAAANVTSDYYYVGVFTAGPDISSTDGESDGTKVIINDKMSEMSLLRAVVMAREPWIGGVYIGGLAPATTYTLRWRQRPRTKDVISGWGWGPWSDAIQCRTLERDNNNDDAKLVLTPGPGERFSFPSSSSRQEQQQQQQQQQENQPAAVDNTSKTYLPPATRTLSLYRSSEWTQDPDFLTNHDSGDTMGEAFLLSMLDSRGSGDGDGGVGVGGGGGGGGGGHVYLHSQPGYDPLCQGAMHSSCPGLSGAGRPCLICLANRMPLAQCPGVPAPDANNLTRGGVDAAQYFCGVSWPAFSLDLTPTYEYVIDFLPTTPGVPPPAGAEFGPGFVPYSSCNAPEWGWGDPALGSNTPLWPLCKCASWEDRHIGRYNMARTNYACPPNSTSKEPGSGLPACNCTRVYEMNGVTRQVALRGVGQTPFWTVIPIPPSSPGQPFSRVVRRAGSWYSTRAEGQCAANTPLGTNGCTWRMRDRVRVLHRGSLLRQGWQSGCYPGRIDNCTLHNVAAWHRAWAELDAIVEPDNATTTTTTTTTTATAVVSVTTSYTNLTSTFASKSASVSMSDPAVTASPSDLPVPPISFQIHSYNDLRLVPQALAKGATWMKFDPHWMPPTFCAKQPRVVVSPDNHSSIPGAAASNGCLLLSHDTPAVGRAYNTTTDLLHLLAAAARAQPQRRLAVALCFKWDRPLEPVCGDSAAAKQWRSASDVFFAAANHTLGGLDNVELVLDGEAVPTKGPCLVHRWPPWNATWITGQDPPAALISDSPTSRGFDQYQVNNMPVGTPAGVHVKALAKIGYGKFQARRYPFLLYEPADRASIQAVVDDYKAGPSHPAGLRFAINVDPVQLRVYAAGADGNVTQTGASNRIVAPAGSDYAAMAFPYVVYANASGALFYTQILSSSGDDSAPTACTLPSPLGMAGSEISAFSRVPYNAASAFADAIATSAVNPAKHLYMLGSTGGAVGWITGDMSGGRMRNGVKNRDDSCPLAVIATSKLGDGPKISSAAPWRNHSGALYVVQLYTVAAGSEASGCLRLYSVNESTATTNWRTTQQGNELCARLPGAAVSAHLSLSPPPNASSVAGFATATATTTATATATAFAATVKGQGCAPDATAGLALVGIDLPSVGATSTATTTAAAAVYRLEFCLTSNGTINLLRQAFAPTVAGVLPRGTLSPAPDGDGLIVALVAGNGFCFNCERRNKQPLPATCDAKPMSTPFVLSYTVARFDSLVGTAGAVTSCTWPGVTHGVYDQGTHPTVAIVTAPVAATAASPSSVEGQNSGGFTVLAVHRAMTLADAKLAGENNETRACGLAGTSSNGLVLNSWPLPTL